MADDLSDDELPIKLGPCSNGEYDPYPLGPVPREAIRRFRHDADRAARRRGIGRRDFIRSTAGAALFLFLLEACDSESSDGSRGGRMNVPPEATDDSEAARDALGGDEFVFDVQTHYLDFDLAGPESAGFGLAFPQAQCGEDDPRTCFSVDHYLEEVFLKSDTTMAVISAIPVPDAEGLLAIDDMELARRTLTTLCGDDRILLHGHATPSIGDLAASLDAMDALVAEHPIAAWKVYTHAGNPPWWLDDRDADAPQVGNAFLDRAEQLGVTTVCVHKGFAGIGGDAEYASPADIGPAAAAHPDLNFVVYHSGYDGPEAEFSDADASIGVNRLVASARASGIGPGGNVYAELGSTWRSVMSNPTEAAHVLGKLLAQFGPDNVVWGTDSIWYGSPQDQIQAFRAFEITPEFQERYGYPELTPEVKRKILGENSARLYGVEPVRTACDFTPEELEEVRVALPSPNRTYGPTTAAAVREHVAAHGWA